MNIHSSLITELRDKTYRDAYVASQIRIGLPFQIRALRKAKDWTQEKLAESAGMAQPRIAEIEKPGERRLNLDTLLRLAAAFDVGLDVRFVPFGTLIERNEAFDPDSFTVKSFNEELREEEAKEQPAALVDFTAEWVAANARSFVSTADDLYVNVPAEIISLKDAVNAAIMPMVAPAEWSVVHAWEPSSFSGDASLSGRVVATFEATVPAATGRVLGALNYATAKFIKFGEREKAAA